MVFYDYHGNSAKMSFTLLLFAIVDLTANHTRARYKMNLSPKKHLVLGVIILCILSIPLIAMQFSTEVNWSISDFVIAAILLFSFALIGVFASRKLSSFKYRYFVYLLIILCFLLLWAELAVGILNTPISGS